MEPTTAQIDIQRLLSHSDWLRSLAGRLVKDASLADDLVQETWMAAMKSPPDPSRPVRPWLAGVVRKLAAMRARSEGRRARRQTVAARKDGLPSTAELIEGVDTQRRLAGTVLALPEPYRSTVILRYYNGLSAAEISRRQGVPAGTVRWRLKRGLEEMRGKLDKSYETRGAWCTALLSLAGSDGAAGGGIAAATTWISTLPLWQMAGILFLAILAGLGWSEMASLDSRQQPLEDALSLTDSARSGVGRATAGPGVSGTAGEPTPEGMRTAAAPDAGRSASLRVLDAEGEGAAGHEVVWVYGEGKGEAVRTDRDGRVFLFLPPGTTRGTAYVQRHAAFIHHADIEFTDEGEPVVRFPAENVFSGRIEIAGRPPERPIKLELDYDQEIYGRPLPRVVEKAFGMVRRSSTITDEDGCFRFLVPPGWSGELWFPPGLVIDADWKTRLDGTREHIDGPGDSYVARLKVLPRVSGRLVEADGVTPVPRPQYHCLVVWEDGKVRDFSDTGAEDGRFEFILPRSDARSITFEVGAENMRGQRTFRIGRDRLPAALALGDVAIETAVRIPFEVLTSSGQPIPGAAARLIGARTVSGPTGVDGRGVLSVPVQETVRLSFGAPGFSPTEREVRVGEQLPAVQLQRSTRLTVTAVDGDNQPMPNACIRVLLDAPLFDDSDSMAPGPWSTDVLSGTWVNAREYEPGRRGIANFLTDGAGKLVLDGIADSVPMIVRILDVTARTMVEREVAPLAPGEQRRLTLESTAPMPTLRGIVRDEDGRVLVGVRVVIRSAPQCTANTRSERTGKFEFAPVTRDTLEIDLSKRGYERKILTDVMVPRDGRELEFTLSRGHRVDVFARDDTGTGVPRGLVSATAVGDDRTWDAVEVDPGLYVLKDLPDEPVRVTLEVGGATYEKLHDPRIATLAFELAVHGRLLVRWNVPDGEEGTETFRLRLVPAGREDEGSGRESTEVVREVESVGRRTGTELIEALLPGTWELHLEARRDGRTGPWLTIGESGAVTVVAGEETPAEL